MVYLLSQADALTAHTAHCAHTARHDTTTRPAITGSLVAKLGEHGVDRDFILLCLAGIALSFLLPFLAYLLFRRLGGIEPLSAAAILRPGALITMSPEVAVRPVLTTYLLAESEA